jgi:hypothetical protein
MHEPANEPVRLEHLEETSELGFAIGNVRLVLDQRRNHPAQGQQRLVDLAGLLFPVALCIYTNT